MPGPMPRSSHGTGCALAALLLLAACPARAQGLPGDPGQGRDLAIGWCVECHEVVPGVREPSVTEAPPFQAVADDPAVTEAALRAFLQTPHATMPDFRLAAEDADDLISYILSLRGRRPGA